MRVFAATVVTASLLAAAGCTGGDDPGVESISLSKLEVWASPQLGLRSVTGVAMRDSIAVIAGYSVGSGKRLAAADVNGGIRWTIDESDPLPGGDGARADASDSFGGASGDPVLVRGRDGWSVIVEYARGRTTKRGHVDEHGLAAVAVRDGSVQWMSPPVMTIRGEVVNEQPREGKADHVIHLGTAGGDVVTASVSPIDHGTPDDIRMLAFSTSDGRKLWEEAGVWPRAVAGDVVLGQVPPAGDPLRRPPWDRGSESATVAAFDAKTGEQRWSFAERFSKAGLQVAAGDLAVVDVQKEDTDRYTDNTLVIDVETGRTVIDFKDLGLCESDGETLIACSGVRSSTTLATVRVADRKAHYSKKNVNGDDYDWSVTGVWNNRVFLRIENAHVEVDRDANKVGRELPGEVAAISDRHAVFLTPGQGSSDDTCAGYEVTR